MKKLLIGLLSFGCFSSFANVQYKSFLELKELNLKLHSYSIVLNGIKYSCSSDLRKDNPLSRRSIKFNKYDYTEIYLNNGNACERNDLGFYTIKVSDVGYDNSLLSHGEKNPYLMPEGAEKKKIQQKTSFIEFKLTTDIWKKDWGYSAPEIISKGDIYNLKTRCTERKESRFFLLSTTFIDCKTYKGEQGLLTFQVD